MEISIVTSAQLCLCIRLVLSVAPNLVDISERGGAMLLLHFRLGLHTWLQLATEIVGLCRWQDSWECQLSGHKHSHHSSSTPQECRLKRTASFGLVTKTIDSIKHMRREISSISSVACLLAQPDFYLDTMFLLRMVYTHTHLLSGDSFSWRVMKYFQWNM